MLEYLKVFFSWPLIVLIFGLVVAGEWLVILADRGDWKVTLFGSTFEFKKHGGGNQ